jgi:hypothetical protein
MKSEKKLKTKMSRIAAILWLILFGFTAMLKAGPVDVEKAKTAALTQLKKTTGDEAGLLVYKVFNIYSNIDCNKYKYFVY